MKQLIFSFLVVFVWSFSGHSQHITISGKVTDSKQQGISYTSIYNALTPTQSVLSNKEGYYEIRIPYADTIFLVASAVGFAEDTSIILSNNRETISQSFILQQRIQIIDNIRILYNIEQEEDIIHISGDYLQSIAGLSVGGVEATIKTLPGVSSKSELSSSYSVRGGSYDENLVYINGIPTFKPTMASSDRQEGLSVINPYMVNSIEFSSGGFGVQYGDKLSSVLSVSYKDVTQNQIQFEGSLMDANMCIEGLSKSNSTTHLIAARYKNTAVMLSSLEEDGEYRPAFFDVQSLIKKTISPKTSVSYWLYGANNTFRFFPTDRVTDFGNFQQTYRMRVFFNGNEFYQYQNIGNAVSITQTPHSRLQHTSSIAYYRAAEFEKYDVLSRYRLDEIQAGEERTQKKDSVQALAIGSFLEHGRNSLVQNSFQLLHDGKYMFDNSIFSWGATHQINTFDAHYNEWTYRDSANYALPYSDTIITLESVKQGNITHSNQITAFYTNLQSRYSWGSNKNHAIRTNIGIRVTYDDYTKSVLYNPRMRVLYKPESDKDIGIAFSAGVYHQPPQFKELIGTDGTFYHDVQAQRAIHYVLGYSSNETLWGRPFFFTTDIYYKKLTHTIPYIINNVNTIYFPELEAQGYITGIDVKLNGEFVKDVESWMSLSIMRARENLKETDIWIRKPNDQLLNFSMFFQDYMPGSNHIKMNMTFLLGSKLPIAAPNSSYENFDAFELSPYSRIDIGFIFVLVDNSVQKIRTTSYQKIWLGAEVFNLMNIGNKISYFWITDVNNNMYGVPNYLTSRRLNLKLSITL